MHALSRAHAHKHLAAHNAWQSSRWTGVVRDMYNAVVWSRLPGAHHTRRRTQARAGMSICIAEAAVCVMPH
jgi:hypothetical protein